MPEETAVGGKDAEGVAAVEKVGGFSVETAGDEKERQELMGEAIVVRIEVDDRVYDEDVS